MLDSVRPGKILKTHHHLTKKQSLKMYSQIILVHRAKAPIHSILIEGSLDARAPRIMVSSVKSQKPT